VAHLIDALPAEEPVAGRIPIIPGGIISGVRLSVGVSAVVWLGVRIPAVIRLGVSTVIRLRVSAVIRGRRDHDALGKRKRRHANKNCSNCKCLSCRHVSDSFTDSHTFRCRSAFDLNQACHTVEAAGVPLVTNSRRLPAVENAVSVREKNRLERRALRPGAGAHRRRQDSGHIGKNDCGGRHEKYKEELIDLLRERPIYATDRQTRRPGEPVPAVNGANGHLTFVS